jgi:hypothetical protein
VVVEVEVRAKVYVVEAESMLDVFTKNPALLAGQHFVVKLALFLRRRLKEVQLMDYILDLISLDI